MTIGRFLAAIAVPSLLGIAGAAYVWWADHGAAGSGARCQTPVPH